jgi:hypothetical protein
LIDFTTRRRFVGVLKLILVAILSDPKLGVPGGDKKIPFRYALAKLSMMGLSPPNRAIFDLRLRKQSVVA